MLSYDLHLLAQWMSADWQTLSPTGQPTPELHKPGRSNESSPHVCLTPGLSKDNLTLCRSNRCGVGGCLPAFVVMISLHIKPFSLA